MFGIGMPEMLLLLAVALIIFGPKKLPELAKSIGRALGEFKRATSEIKDNIEEQTGLGEVRESLNSVQKDIKAQVDLGMTETDEAVPEKQRLRIQRRCLRSKMPSMRSIPTSAKRPYRQQHRKRRQTIQRPLNLTPEKTARHDRRGQTTVHQPFG
jgi:TatA/E family protein of Tat protein translocase